jgi:large subunit ribosomal protein L21
MYAVIESGGKQYKVGVGDRVKVEKLLTQEGDSISFDRVLMVSDGEKTSIGSPVLETVVTAKVVGHGKGEKIKVFKMKRRKNYRRTQGHRQSFTEIEITAIGGGSKKAAKPARDEANAEVKPKAKKAEGKKAATKKKVAKKAATKKQAAKKATSKKATSKKATSKKATSKKATSIKKETTKKAAAGKKKDNDA